jgi:hypothetical protein
MPGGGVRYQLTQQGTIPHLPQHSPHDLGTTFPSLGMSYGTQGSRDDDPGGPETTRGGCPRCHVTQREGGPLDPRDATHTPRTFGPAFHLSQESRATRTTTPAGTTVPRGPPPPLSPRPMGATRAPPPRPVPTPSGPTSSATRTPLAATQTLEPLTTASIAARSHLGAQDATTM